MRTALYVLLALAAPAFAGQTVYKWVDEKGVTHFSDQPIAGAEKVELSSGPNRAATPAAPSYTPSPSQNTPTRTGPAYSRFVIESPQQDQAFINTGGKVSVQLAASPPIGSNQVALYLDGSRVSDFEPNAMSYEFSNLARGTHTVKATVSAGGSVIQETPPVTFHVRQESAAQPPVGPGMRQTKPKRSVGNKQNATQPSYQALNGGKASIDPRTNMPVIKKPAAPNGPKAGN
jgi:hypothetical protein